MSRHIFTIVLVSGLFLGCQSSSSINMVTTEVAFSKMSDQIEAGETGATVMVKGMGCPFCATNIKKSLANVNGIKQMGVDLGQGRVLLLLNENEAPTAKELENAINESCITVDSVQISGAE